MTLRASVQLLQPPRPGRLLCTLGPRSHISLRWMESQTYAGGMKELPSPDFGGPSSISQDEGASTAVTGSFVS
ncbi:uncharacterized protein FPRO_03214 [Fusarium proliferatum ET1]|uniref:Uncharacterized protein n=1 Tax=Fusarium proliferatum (strain ET1) TaxID=1227346 RepID=A0A1L7VAD6_FUSPR|nr:uncharacterized protein FPRO_03214 [Fusarium proliferatum ET1]CZR36526.1 uncharacterized protein FPRO_03214 [Fusarium proliferatum ET1]